MPCSAPARGTKSGALPPFNDATDNNPCGRRVITNAGGVAFADGLCLFHLMMKHGQLAVKPPYVDAA